MGQSTANKNLQPHTFWSTKENYRTFLTSLHSSPLPSLHPVPLHEVKWMSSCCEAENLVGSYSTKRLTVK